MASVTVEYYGRLSAATGHRAETLPLKNIRNVSELIVFISNKYNNENLLDDCAAAINDQMVDTGTVLNDGDNIALLPPVSGG